MGNTGKIRRISLKTAGGGGLLLPRECKGETNAPVVSATYIVPEYQDSDPVETGFISRRRYCWRIQFGQILVQHAASL
jgi:hypothetical protein